MRVLHAPVTALYQPALMVRGLRAHGVEADLMYHAGSFASMRFDLPDQIVLGSGDIATPTLGFFLEAIRSYDVFHLHSGYSPVFQSRKGKELRLLAKLGKLVVLSRWGCSDGRTPSSWFAERGLCDLCPVPSNGCNDALNAMRLEREDRHAHILINHELDFEEFNRRAVFLHGLIDLDFWRPDLEIPEAFRYPERSPGEVRVIHAVGGENRGDVKGSAAVRAAVETLRSKGLVVEYREVRGIPVQDLRWHILQTDIVVDQLRYGSFGSFAREAMALGRPVVGHVIPVQRQGLPGLPVVQADTRSLPEVLERLVRSSEERRVLGESSRAYAEREFCHLAIAARLADLYRSALEELRHAVP